MSEHLSVKAYELTCLSPVHIGDGQIFRAYEYLSYRGTVYFLCQDDWLALLNKKGKLDAFIDLVEGIPSSQVKSDAERARMRGKQIHSPSFTDWAMGLIQPPAFEKLSSHQAKVHYEIGSTRTKAWNNIARQMMTVGNAKTKQLVPYIPGSSLKGAFRTAILFHLLRMNKAVADDLRQEIMNARGKLKKTWGDSMQYAEEALLARLNPPKMRTGSAPKQILDALRGLRISDALPVSGALPTVIMKKYDITTKLNKNGDDENDLPLSRECIPRGAKFRFTITIENEMLKALGISSMAEILRAAKAYLQYGISLQEKVFPSNFESVFDEAKEATLLLGGGTGFLSKTLIYPLFDKFEARSYVAKYLDEAFPQGEHLRNDTKLAPRTLKLAEVEKGDYSLLGLCKIREVKG